MTHEASWISMECCFNLQCAELSLEFGEFSHFSSANAKYLIITSSQTGQLCKIKSIILDFFAAVGSFQKQENNSYSSVINLTIRLKITVKPVGEVLYLNTLSRLEVNRATAAVHPVSQTANNLPEEGMILQTVHTWCFTTLSTMSKLPPCVCAHTCMLCLFVWVQRRRRRIV